MEGAADRRREAAHHALRQTFGCIARLASIVADVARVDVDAIDEQTDLASDLGLDAIHLMDIVMRAEDEFEIVAGPEFEEPRKLYQLQRLLEHAALTAELEEFS